MECGVDPLDWGQSGRVSSRDISHDDLVWSQRAGADTGVWVDRALQIGGEEYEYDHSIEA
jgi:hypothetical protein